MKMAFGRVMKSALRSRLQPDHLGEAVGDGQVAESGRKVAPVPRHQGRPVSTVPALVDEGHDGNVQPATVNKEVVEV